MSHIRFPPRPFNSEEPIEGDLDGNWNKLVVLASLYISPEVKREVGAMLEGLKADTIVDIPGDGEQPDSKQTQLGFYRAPAAKANHHAFEGGLVFHILEMWDCWILLRSTLQDQAGAFGISFVSDHRVLLGILAHDLHKAYRTFKKVDGPEWATDYCKDDSDYILTETHKSLYLLSHAGIILDEVQLNALICSHGGYTKDEPRSRSVLAKLLYVIDELSGNVRGHLATGNLLGHYRKPK
jgi:hypothetical protein